jgi:hypothetical protein
MFFWVLFEDVSFVWRWYENDDEGEKEVREEDEEIEKTISW